MRNLLVALFLLPAFAMAQTQKSSASTFVKLLNPAGQQIVGDNMNGDKGTDRWITANTLNTSGNKNETVTFTMSMTGAAADLKKAFNTGEVLISGEINVLRPMANDGRRLPAYTIKMENIRVVSCTENIGCNNAQATTVTLQAGRIGWIYYDANRPALTVANKYGYDVEKGTEWTSF